MEKSEIMGLLMQRYPDIAFHLSYTHFTPHSDITHESVSLPDLEKVDVLYVYGLGRYYEALKSWLQSKRHRQLIIFEDGLAAIDAFLSEVNAAEILHCPQVHLHYLASPKEWDALLEEQASTYPSQSIEVLATKAYAESRKKRYRWIRLQLMRKTASIHALLSEALYYHKLFGNLLPNFRRIPEAFYVNEWKDRFKNIPAVICGAGPSLKSSIPILKQMQQRALILAGGSTITALSAQGISPHLGLALDPNEEEYLRLKPSSSFATPLLYANRLLPDIFNTCNGPYGYMRSETGGASEAWLEDKLDITGDALGPDLGREAFSVTTLAIALACHLGCNPIILTGVDLAFTGMQRYAGGVVAQPRFFLEDAKKEKRAGERMLRRKDREGKWVYTLVKWVMESESIGNYAKLHPECTFINATEGGIGFPGIPFQPLQTIAEQSCKVSFDIKGRIHAEIMRSSLSRIEPCKVEKELEQLFISLKRCHTMCAEMIEELERIEGRVADPEQPLETGKRVILESDFQDEPAFDSLLQNLGPSIDRVMDRCYHFPEDIHSLEYRKKNVEKSLAKWKQFKTAIEAHLQTYKD